jgi:hypothetical protein
MEILAAQIFLVVLGLSFFAIFNCAFLLPSEKEKRKITKLELITINTFFLIAWGVTFYGVAKGDAWLLVHAPWLRYLEFMAH